MEESKEKVNEKKISIIIPVYNAEEFLPNCLNVLTSQSYKNYELIVVNDGSLGNCKEIVEKYMNNNNKIKYIEHEVNKGLFQARITGFYNSTGDYIAFLDADDYLSNDYYRELIEKAENTKSDIVFSNVVMDYGNNNRKIFNLCKLPFEELTGEECLDEFYKQEGLNFTWHILPNKIYSRNIWEKAINEYKNINNHLIMTEDFAFSNVLFYYAKKVTKVDKVAFFYSKHDGASTSVEDFTYKKIVKNIDDLTTSFSFVEDFLKKKNIYDKYKEQFEKWRALYCQIHKSSIDIQKLSNDELITIEKKFEKFCPKQFDINNDKFFYSVCTDWDNRLDWLKEEIIKEDTKIVSFDIFDTLIVRPFLYPKDLFIFLNEDYRKMSNNLAIDFSKIREDCEVIAREENNLQKKEEVTLDRIYEIIEEQYSVPNKITQVLKQKEIELELRFCRKRETAYSLYKLAKYLGKRVICTSDMYLPLEVIKKILNKNGYNEIDKVYLSCELMKTKATGSLYEYVIQEEGVFANNIVHIGDNYYSDYEIAKKMNINSIYFQKATDVMLDKNLTNNLAQMLTQNMPFWRDNKASMKFIGIRCMLAVVGNKYFDNPFITYNHESDFNVDPYLIGYYLVGSYLFGVANWLLKETENKGYKNIVFMARDGYLAMQVYNILKKYYNNVPDTKYLRVSRKALISAMIINKMDLYKLTDVINIQNHAPKYIIKYIKDSLKECSEQEIMDVIEKNGIKYDEDIKEINEFNKLIKIISNDLFDEEKNNRKTKKLKEFFEEYFEGKSATFDVGYSGRPELYLSILCQKPIDTFFLNINQDEALKYSKIAGYNLKTFFDAKPSVTGFAYESLISELAPSTIGYDLNGEYVKPILETNTISYQEKYIINMVQKAAIEFVEDISNIFGSDFKDLYYQDYYISLPFISYINSSKPIDMLIFNSIDFEDTIRIKNKKPITEDWIKERTYKNQQSMDYLINSDSNNVKTNIEKIIKEENDNIQDNINDDDNIDDTKKDSNSKESNVIGDNESKKENNYLEYNNVDLNNHCKFVRLIYYVLFDRQTLKRRIKEIFNKTRRN